MRIPGFRHVGLKVLSLALGALIWLLVSGEICTTSIPNGARTSATVR